MKQLNPIMFLIQGTGAAVFIIMLEFLFVPPIPRRQKIFLYLYIVFCSMFLSIYTGNLGTPILLAGCFLILLFAPAKFRLWNIMIFQIVWFWSVLTDYAVTIPLRFLGYDFDRIRSSPPMAFTFLLVHALLAILPCAFFRKRIHLGLRTYGEGFAPVMQWLLLGEMSICSGIYLFNIIAGSFTNYPTQILLFNGILIFAFTFVNFLILFLVYRALSENKRLALQAQEREKLVEYTKQLESHYQEIRRFKHDYMNILATINGYIQENDMNRLKAYFNSRLLPTGRNLLDKDAVIARLSNIKVLEIKGLFYTKLIQAMNLGLNVSLELTEEIAEIPMNLLVLSRILGIYLDNAMEAASATDEKLLHAALIRRGGDLIFHIENSTPALPCSLDELTAPGFTTKENHSGLGLSTVAELLADCPDVSVCTGCESGRFRQILTLHCNRKN